jgi:Flp pilus assembly protein TadG
MAARTRSPRQRGQATVELALGLPVLMMAVLLVIQVGLVVGDQVRVVQAAREGAREAAVDAAPGAARRAAIAGAGLDPRRATVVVSGRGAAGSQVTVRVTYRSVTDVPLVGFLLPDPVVTAQATMRVEG